MTKKSDDKAKAPGKKGATELNEEQLDDVSGGPHFQTLDGLKSTLKATSETKLTDRLPGGSIRAGKV